MGSVSDSFSRNKGEAVGLYDKRLKNDGDEVIYQIYPRSFKDSDRNGQGDVNGITSMLDYLKSLDVDAIWISPMYKSPPGPAGDGGYAVEDHRSIDPVYGTHGDFQNLLTEAHGRGLKVYLDFVLPHTANTHPWFEASRDTKHSEHEKYKNFYVWHKGHHLIDGKCLDADEAKIVAKEKGIELPAVPLVPNNWKSVFAKGTDNSAWTWDSKREAFYMHHFLQSQPAVNLNLEHVQDAVFDDMQYWLDMGVDGFRLDSVPFANYDPEFRDNKWQRGQYPYEGCGWEDQEFTYSMCQDSTKALIGRMRERFPDAKLMGEVIAGKNGGRDSIEQAADYVEAGLDSCYTTYGWAIGSSHADYIRGLLEGIVEKFPEGGVWLPVSTHDCYEKSPRTYTRIAQHLKDRGQEEYLDRVYKQTLQIFATFGTFSLYQGDELGLPNARMGTDIPLDKAKDPITHTMGPDRSRDVVRTAFPSNSTQKHAGFSDSDEPYLPVAGPHKELAVDIQKGNPNSTLVFTQNLIHWRSEQSALKNGKVKILPTNGDTVAFLRENEEQIILCAYNLGPHEFEFRPADVLNGEEMQKLGLTRDFKFHMESYDGQFASRAKAHQYAHEHEFDAPAAAKA